MDETKGKQPFEIPYEGNELTRAARRKIDEDIAKIKRTIKSLKRRRNELSPISVLPSEVLSKIFILARHWSLEVKFKFYNTDTSWISIGHVCQHWRQVALGCPSLWSLPVFTRPDLAQAMMQRSKMAALTIRSDAGSRDLKVFEQLGNAIAQIHRVQSIKLMLEFHLQKLETIFSPLSQPAPLLEEVVFCDGPRYGTRIAFPTEALSDAPRLRSVDFDHLNFNWESAVFRHRNLTNLRLTDNFDDTATISQMMDVLCHLPNLRTLALINSIPSHTTRNGNEKVSEFHFLEHLELRAKAEDCIFLLRHIRYPPGATVRLHSSSTTVEDSTTILSLVGQNLHRIQNVKPGAPRSPMPIQSARLTSLGMDGSPEITFYSEVDDTGRLDTVSSAFSPIITILFGCDRTLTQPHGPLLLTLSNDFNLSSLQYLFLGWSFTYDDIHVVRDILGKLPKLKAINICRSLPEICLAIAENSNDSSTEGPEETQIRNSLCSFPPVTILPALRSLVIKSVDFRKDHYPENVEHLIDMLMKRSDMNAPIDRLSIEGCLGVRTLQNLKRLGELVVYLEVAHKIINVRELDSDDQE